MDKIKIETKMLKGEKLYSKICPFGVNDELENLSPSHIPVIRAVGSRLCKKCESFIKIVNNAVYCK